MTSSTIFSLHSQASELAPTRAGGFRFIKASTFVLRCMTTPTGLMLAATASKDTPEPVLKGFLVDVYRAYANYVHKNPFSYENQPIKTPDFGEAVEEAGVAAGLLRS